MALIHPNCINSLSSCTKTRRNFTFTSKSSSPLSMAVQRRKKFSVSAVSTASGETSINGVTTTTRSLTEKKSLQTGKSSSAMEQLDIERGVCVPFRKYTPETVRLEISNYVYLFVLFIFSNIWLFMNWMLILCDYE